MVSKSRNMSWFEGESGTNQN